MNWLAHVFLSKPDIEHRLGNLLADLVKGRDRASMSPAFLEGVRQHQAIDAFTDSHPVVHTSRARIGGGHEHVAGILIDIFYDHFLALDWARYCAEPLETFTTRLYADIRAHPLPLPAEAQAAIDRMIHDDRLGSYRRVEGIEATLQRVSMRLTARTGRELKLERAVSELYANYVAFAAEFAAFFPLLQAYLATPKEAVRDASAVGPRA